MQRSRNTEIAAPARPQSRLVIALDRDGVILESLEAKTRSFGCLFAGHGAEASELLAAEDAP